MRRPSKKSIIIVTMLVLLLLAVVYRRGDDLEEKKQRNRTIRHKVIILTYMRSGSSLTGDLLQQSPDVFFVFEPLWMTNKIFKGLHDKYGYKLPDNSSLSGQSSYIISLSSLVPIPSVPVTTQQLDTRYKQVMEAFLNCRLQDVDVSTLMQFFMNRGHSTKEFIACVGNELSRLNACLKSLTTRCQNARVVVIKVIRSSMQLLSSIMANIPEVTIIHLIRDPRGTLNSQHAVGYFRWGYLGKLAARQCSRIEKDITMSRNLSQAFPNRILTVRYEDIADSPIGVINQVYSRLGLSLTTEIRGYIWNVTYGGHPDGCKMCINRRNASRTANHWRSKLTITDVHAIQQQCTSVFNIMGYKMFTLQSEVENLLVPSRDASYSPDLMKVDGRNLDFAKRISSKKYF